jgi:hypothetical protein
LFDGLQRIICSTNIHSSARQAFRACQLTCIGTWAAKLGEGAVLEP